MVANNSQHFIANFLSVKQDSGERKEDDMGSSCETDIIGPTSRSTSYKRDQV